MALFTFFVAHCVPRAVCLETLVGLTVFTGQSCEIKIDLAHK